MDEEQVTRSWRSNKDTSAGPSDQPELFQFGSVQSLSHVRLFAIPWTAACLASLSITNSQRLLKLTSIESVMPSNHLILCHPLLLPPSIFPNIRVFASESVLPIRLPKYWSFSFSISPSNEHSGLISFRTDWFDLLAAQGTLKRRKVKWLFRKKNNERHYILTMMYFYFFKTCFFLHFSFCLEKNHIV